MPLAGKTGPGATLADCVAISRRSDLEPCPLMVALLETKLRILEIANPCLPRSARRSDGPANVASIPFETFSSFAVDRRIDRARRHAADMALFDPRSERIQPRKRTGGIRSCVEEPQSTHHALVGGLANGHHRANVELPFFWNASF